MHLPKLERRPELDALRGLFLVWMTLTHLPPGSAISSINPSAMSPLRRKASLSFSALLVRGGSMFASCCRTSPGFDAPAMEALAENLRLSPAAVGFCLYRGRSGRSPYVQSGSDESSRLLPGSSRGGDCGLHPADLLPAAARHLAHVCHLPFLYSAVAFGVVALWLEEDSGSQRRGVAARSIRPARSGAQCHRQPDPPANSAAGDGRLQLICLAGGMDCGLVAGRDVCWCGSSAENPSLGRSSAAANGCLSLWCAP